MEKSDYNCEVIRRAKASYLLDEDADRIIKEKEKNMSKGFYAAGKKWVKRTPAFYDGEDGFSEAGEYVAEDGTKVKFILKSDGTHEIRYTPPTKTMNIEEGKLEEALEKILQ